MVCPDCGSRQTIGNSWDPETGIGIEHCICGTRYNELTGKKEATTNE